MTELLRILSGAVSRAADKAPAKYFPDLIAKAGEAAFAAQCIPTDPRLLDVDEFKAFLAERRQLIADRLNAFLETGK